MALGERERARGEHEGAEGEHESTAREHMDKTGLNARAKRQGPSQEKVMCCTGFPETTTLVPDEILLVRGAWLYQIR